MVPQKFTLAAYQEHLWNARRELSLYRSRYKGPVPGLTEIVETGTHAQIATAGASMPRLAALQFHQVRVSGHGGLIQTAGCCVQEGANRNTE